ncbi:MAG: hypothetical protein LPK02_07160 [Rhodobacterales bacterium]|nr:hypothetical protein [Rhodobacterales bacterium]
MIIGVKLVKVGGNSEVFSFSANRTVGSQALSNFFGEGTAEMLLQLSEHHRAADKLEIMRRFRRDTPSGCWPHLEPIIKIGHSSSGSKTIMVTNDALDCVGQYVFWDGNHLTDGSIHVDTICGRCYNLMPSDYRVIG